MLLLLIIIAYWLSAVSLVMGYREGKRILAMLPDSQPNEAFAGSLSRVFSLNDDPAIRNRQRSLIKWIARTILFLTIAGYAQTLGMDEKNSAGSRQTMITTDN